MDIRSAMRLLVANIPGGWATAARLCGNDEDAMRKAWAEAASRYVPNAADAQVVSEHAISLQTPHCYAYVRAVAENAGGRFEIGGAAAQEAGFKQLPVHTSRLMQECNDVAREVMQAMADGQLCANERRVIRKELLELAEAMRQVDGDIDADERSTTPTPLRRA